MISKMIAYLSTPDQPVTTDEFMAFWRLLSREERKQLFKLSGLSGLTAVYGN